MKLDSHFIVKDVTVKRGRRVILDSVSFEHQTGVLGVMGANGSGKSTLLDVCAQALRPNSGYAQIVGGFGDPIKQTKQIGYLPQFFSFPKSLTIEDFLGYVAWLRGSRSASGDLARNAMNSVGLGQYSRMRLGKASGGMVRRAGFAAAILMKPTLLILDEPTTGVDAEQRIVLQNLIKEESRNRMTILASHLAEDIERLCDEFLLLDGGRIAYRGTVEEALALSSTSTLDEAIVEIPKLVRRIE